ncbi:uncharacterized protein AB675_10627 [Cyphellophora attinorum]|uniref:Uncharacterized protein n=1 Tax=Cyphellophora attinorum TaxID=1664694 RepID=A0A0N1HAF1_9EURO|nr:uncharacterized protein AB675_10627 [Phialophora attinorum]KPI40810.1 hypothetical protein AB675_10627 [Phialophora attinorum]
MNDHDWTEALDHEPNSRPLTDNEVITEILQRLQDLDSTPTSAQADLQARLSIARSLIRRIDSLSLLSSPERFESQLQIVSGLQNLAYYDTAQGGVEDIASWCLRAYLQLMAQGHEDSAEVLAGIGRGWLLRVQATLARIHRYDGSSSSGTSSDRPSSMANSTERVGSFTASEDAREFARQTIEANARAGGADYVEARGMLLPATEYLQRSVEAAERNGTLEGSLLSLAAEAFLSMGNVSYSHHSEQYFQMAVRYLQMAHRIPDYRLSPYLQSYLDEFGRLLP